MSRNKVALLHGAGLDSTAVALYLLKHEVNFDAIHFDYGQIASKFEWETIKRQAEKLKFSAYQESASNLLSVNDVRNSQLFSGNHSHEPIVEGRNLYFIMSAVFLGYKDIYIGIDKPATGNAWPDASENFILNVNNVLQFSFLKSYVKVIAPFINIDKQQVFKESKKLWANFFDGSMTCWTPENFKECGKCKHCKLKRKYKEECNE